MKVVEAMDACTDEDVIAMIERLTNGEWFTSRISACGLFGATYTKCDDNCKTTLRSMYQQLCGDDTPMVRRAAAHHLGVSKHALDWLTTQSVKFSMMQGFSQVVGANSDKKLLLEDIMPLLNKLALDDQDSVRLLAIENCAAMCGLLTEEENSQVCAFC